MSKWIDYDAIDYRNDRLHDKSEEFLNGVIYMAQRIEEATSIDIVHCKDCEWSEPNNEGDYDCKCHIPTFRVPKDGYCNFGERIDNE